MESIFKHTSSIAFKQENKNSPANRTSQQSKLAPSILINTKNKNKNS